MHTAPTNPRQSDPRALLRGISVSPFVRVDLHGDHATVRTRVRDTRIARLNVETGALTVFAVVAMARSVVRTQPQLRLTRDGVSVHVSDPDSRTAAERLIRWRIDVERFGPQLHTASP
jgi:hypothetical protein